MVTASILVLLLAVVAAASAVEQTEHRHTSRHIHTEPAANEMRVEPPLPILSREYSGTKPATEERHLWNFLNDMKSGTKVFQHFLAKSNLSQIVEGELILLYSI